MNAIALAADLAAPRLKSPVGAPTDSSGDGSFDELIARFGADGQGSAHQEPSGLKPVALKHPVSPVLPASTEAGDKPTTDTAKDTGTSSLGLAPLLAKVVAAGGASPPVRNGGKDGGAVSGASDPSGGATVPPLPPGVLPQPAALAITNPSSSASPPTALPPPTGARPGAAAPVAPALDTSDATETAPTLVSAVAIARHPAPAVPSPAISASAVTAPAATDANPPPANPPPATSAGAPGPVSLDASAGSATLIRGVADTIVRLASSSPSAAPATTPARTMTLQLNPGSLGTVSVRLHLTGGALDVQLGVSDPQTLGLIARERDTLIAALRDQSTPIHSLTIGGGDVPPPGGHDARFQRPAGDQAGNRTSGGGSGPSGGQGDRPAPDRRRAEPPGPLAAAAPEPWGALFV